MAGLTYRSAGESHGPSLTGVLDGLPSGLAIDEDSIDRDLAARQAGFGRGGRMRIERDRIVLTGGVRRGMTLGGPLAFSIANRDHANWRSAMSPSAAAPEPASEREAELGSPQRVPRPGHADWAGAFKYRHDDVRNVLERASARETACRVAAGAIAKLLLRAFGIETASHTVRIGGVALERQDVSVEAIRVGVDGSDVRCIDATVGERMREAIKQAAKAEDTIGGVCEVVISGVPAGLGDHTQWDRKLDGRLAAALMSVPSCKAIEIGAGFAQCELPGSAVHDELLYDVDRPDSLFNRGHYHRRTNRAGGIEGGLSNGEDIVVRCGFKPISTLRQPLQSVDISTRRAETAIVERSDTCSVPPAGVVAEAVSALTIADALLRQYGEGSLHDLLDRHSRYLADRAKSWQERALAE